MSVVEGESDRSQPSWLVPGSLLVGLASAVYGVIGVFTAPAVRFGPEAVIVLIGVPTTVAVRLGARGDHAGLKAVLIADAGLVLVAALGLVTLARAFGSARNQL